MLRHLRDWLKFHLESWVQRGVLHQLVLIALLIGGVAGMAGALVRVLGGDFPGLSEAIWWAFLRLTDPGYLGDDVGLLQRTVSTVVTVLGYVLFMGSLIAIMTQWLNATMRTLESGLTPISIKDHILILGWTNRTVTIVRELVNSKGRVKRFLRRSGARKLRIVILAERVSTTLMLELREQLGASWHGSHIIFRSGSSLRFEHLWRVNAPHAAVIIVPGADFALGGSESNDTRVIKTLMSISSLGQTDQDGMYPTMVTEIFDANKIPIAQHAYQGQIDVIASDAFISRLIAQNVRHRGLSYVYAELTSHVYGNEVYVRPCPQFAGQLVRDVMEAFPQAILLGVVRPKGREFYPILNPPDDVVLVAEDRLVLLARSYEETAPLAHFQSHPAPRQEVAVQRISMPPERRILFLGWTHKVQALLEEFNNYAREHFIVDLLSVISASEREASLGRCHFDRQRVQIRQLDGDYTIAADLHQLDLMSYDNIVFLGGDWLESGQESDARTVLGYVLLRSLLPQGTPGPEILVELMDPDNARLFQQRPGEVIISPLILSHMLAHVSLRRELSAVFRELFGPDGAEISFRPARHYTLEGQDVSIRDLQHGAAQHGEIALGVRIQSDLLSPGGGVYLNPPLTQRWRLQEEDEIIILI